MMVSQEAINRGLAIFACCVLYGLFMGMVRMSSLLFVACIAQYNIDRKRASFPFVLAFTVRNLIGPVAGFLGKQFGIRKVVICGVLLSAVSIGACSLADDIATITVLWGVGHGIGYGFGTLLLPHYLSMRFTKHLDKANGITLAGECVTYFLLSVLTEHLLEKYGLSGTFLVLSGVMLNGLLAALLLKNPTRTLERENCGSFAEKEKLQVKIIDPKNCSIPPDDKATKQRKSSTNVFRVFLDPVYILIIFTQSVMLYLFSTTTTILIDVSRDQGVSVEDEVYVFLSMTIGDIIGRTLLGSVTDAGCLTKMNFSALCFAGIGILYAACAWIKHFIMMIVFSFLFGLFIGGLLMISPGVVTFYVEKQYLSVAIASRLILYPPISFTQAPLIGFFRDVLQSYNTLFYLMMGLCCACCFTSLLIPPLAKCRDAKKKPLEDMGTAILSSCLLFCIVLTGVYPSIEFQNHTYVEPEYLENLLATGQYEEFARLLHIDDVNLVKPAEGNRSDDPMFNKGLEGGDILLTPWQREQARQGINFAIYNGSKWKKEVPYVFDNSSYRSAQKRTIMKAIMTWNRDLSSYIRFRPRRSSDESYVMFFSGNGCYSYLGRIGGPQGLSLQANGCLSQGTILHEMTHAVGMAHEHNRADRDNYIKMLFDNIPLDWQSQYEKTSYETFPLLGPYDYYSVMHYPVNAPGTNKPAFEVRQTGIDLSRIGQREGQTELDKDKIKRLYM
ncbi:unnamed protein product [Larinioides sclopetarius]|uniref:Peptidase M12A domain-containing protein n=1 Tax=Larinioides sclopetarius TaxID=280406 RepID=A0AAV2BB86_9ARAC